MFEALLGLSDRMAPYLDDGRTTEKPRALVLNGQTLYVAVGHTAQAPERVEHFYRERYAGGHATLQRVAAEHKGAPPPPPPATALRFGNDDEGGLVAFDLGDTPSLASLQRRYLAFVRNHRLGELGQIRYVRWTRDPDGGTRFLTFWTDRRFSIDGLIPPRGVDVDGGDLAGLPRPSGMTRVLAMEEAGRPYRTRLCECTFLPTKVSRCSLGSA